MQILLPAVPLIGQDFAVANEVAQLTLSLSMLSIALATLIYGPLSDRYGRKPVMLAGLFITLMGSLYCLYSNSIEQLILGRIFQAAGAAVGLVLARAIVRDIYGPTEAAKVIATLVMIMVVLPMISPVVGGELAVRFGLGSIFVLTAVFAGIMMLLLAIMLPETHHDVVRFEGVASMVRTYLLLMRSHRFFGYAFCVTFVSVIFFSFIAAVPEIMVSALNRPATEYGQYFVLLPLGFMAGNMIARRAGQRSLDRMIGLGSKITIVGIVAAIVLQLFGIMHPLALFLPIAVAILGNGITLPNAQAAAINEFPQYAGSASGLTGFLQMAFSAIGAQLVAVIYNGTAFPLLALMFSASVFSLLAFRLVNRSAH